ncbi:MAG: aminotransferase class III-fold pyridoxal phosphate-dependent enzyme, partial [Nitrosomonas sp. PRO5]|nr:aminotransferase class III-fold pyridoxal phosphate-dependent enzyme [Nitrosomonas sp. PRO5]
NYLHTLSETDLTLAQKLKGFVPEQVFDIHVHPYHPGHFASTAFPFLHNAGVLGCGEHREAVKRYMPSSTVHGLYFGMPHRSAQRDILNQWVVEEVKTNGTSISRPLKLVSPQDDVLQTSEELRKGMYAGLKVYHIYSSRMDTMNASITEYAPEWMWEILHETKGVLLLHIVRQDAITDPDNQKEIRRLCRTYPGVQLILAHVARSFNYRHARNGLHFLTDIDNSWIDTSAVCESESFRAAIKILGPKRILWGSDFGISEIRGRCVSTGSSFFWLHPEVIKEDHRPPTQSEMTLIGLESLLCLQEACEDSGLNASDINDIFLNNALRVLHLDETELNKPAGPQLWQEARSVISGGTGLLSKRAEMFHREWPSYFSKASGCTVWDLEGQRYLDFAGGIGAVLLGYADEDVNKAVNRRIDAGTYCSLASPDEVTLAGKLLELHPWAGKVRYARGGGEAMSMAVRIARSASGKSGIAFCGYHGWHDWYLAANLGETNALDGHLLPGLQPLGVPRALKGSSVPFRYNDFNSFVTAVDQLGDDFAAVVMEPMRSEEPKDDFVKRVAEYCRKKGGVFVVDEITSGLRYGFPGALSNI